MSGWGAQGAAEIGFEDALKDPWLDDAAKEKIYAELALGQTAAVLIRRGNRDVAALLLDVERAVIEYDYEDQSNDLWLEVPPEHFEQVKAHEETLRTVAVDIAKRRNYPFGWLCVRESLPDVGPDWRERLREQLGQRQPTNHARRVRMQSPAIAEDYLTFTNPGERQVYRALKEFQEKDLPSGQTIGIFPLPGVRVLGHTWEPDVLVTYRGRAGVLEIDGPQHNGRRAMDVTREHLYRDAGVAFVDRVPVEALSDPMELRKTLQRFLRAVADSR